MRGEASRIYEAGVVIDLRQGWGMQKVEEAAPALHDLCDLASFCWGKHSMAGTTSSGVMARHIAAAESFPILMARPRPRVCPETTIWFDTSVPGKLVPVIG